MASIRQSTLDTVFKILTENADELEDGLCPFEILARDERFKKVPCKLLQEVFVELNTQDKVSILWDGDEIVHLFVNRGLNGARNHRPLRPNCVILADTENVRHALKLPPHIFPGDSLNEQIARSGFLVRGRFAFITTKGIHEGVVTAVEVIAQATTLAQQGFFPVICPYVDEKNPSPDDDMLKAVARTYFGFPDVETFLVISGDRDFKDLMIEAEGMGHDFGIFCTSSNASQEWLDKVQSNIIDLPKTDQTAYDFIEKYFKAIKETGTILRPNDENDEFAIMFLDDAIKIIPSINGPLPFSPFCGIIWRNMPQGWKTIYSQDLLNRVLQVIASYTDIIHKVPHTDVRGRPGAGFVFRKESKDIKIFVGIEELPALMQRRQNSPSKGRSGG